MRLLLEAARWAPSSFNEQPWRFLVARREEEDRYERLLGCLTEKNKTWAGRAPVLMVSLARTRFARDGRENRHAWHDVGQAIAHLSVQAAALDLFVHQMAGFSTEWVRTRFDLPEDVEPVAAIALGYLGDPAEAPDGLRERDRDGRTRKPVDELIIR